MTRPEKNGASMERLIRLQEVLEMTGWSRSHIYALVAAGRFPVPLKLGLRAVAWRESEIAQWEQRLPRALIGKR
jgi:prophage regulatory protein